MLLRNLRFRESSCPVRGRKQGSPLPSAGPILAFALALAAILDAAAAASTRPLSESSVRPKSGKPSAGGPGPAVYFQDQTAQTGLRFTHWNGMSGEWYFPEINGAGAALFDYDNDGDLDAYLVQGAPLGPQKGRAAAERPSPGFGPDGVPRDRLFRNDLGPDGPRFVDVTSEVGIDARGYGMAVAAADFDNDGWIDLYLANFGANQLWRNRGPDASGRISFEDMTRAWRVDDRRWSSAIAVADFDRDGLLDLYLGNYLRFEFARQKECRAPSGLRDYCHPSSYFAEEDLLFHNRGSGFVDISQRALPGRGSYPTLGVVVTDADGDGWPDLYVANDDQPNQLWRSQARTGVDGAPVAPSFVEEGLLAGCAVDRRGRPEASMGVDAADYDNDGDEDLFMSHLGGQTNTLYVNGGGLYRDETGRRGLGTPSLPHTGFGTAFVDIDLDGWLDLVVVNGAVQTLDALRRAGDAFPFHETDQVFRNLGSTSGSEGPRFEDVSRRSGLEASRVSRGLAVGDIDNDGDTDLLILDNNGPARVLLGQAIDPNRATSPPWVGLRLVTSQGTDGGNPARVRDALGARVALERRGSPTLWRRVRVDGSYASSRDPRVRFGLSGGKDLERFEVHWPDGSREVFPPPPLDRYTTWVQGEGSAAETGSGPAAGTGEGSARSPEKE